MLLSVVIPSYNHKQYVLKTIQAARKIPVTDKEVIVIDDGSTDGSDRIIREYIEATGLECSVKLVARENRGLVRTLNEGLSLALGKYFYVVASDDIPIPSGIADLVEVLEKRQTLQFALGNALFMNSEQQSEFVSTYGDLHDRFFTLPYEERKEELYLHYPQPILLQATVIRTEVVRASGGWSTDFIGDDFALFVQLLSQPRQAGIDFEYFPRIMACFYRLHGTNSHRNIERQFTMVHQVLNEFCPSEWRGEAMSRNCAIHAVAAVRQGRIKCAARLSRVTIQTVGSYWWIRSMTIEAGKALIRRIVGSRGKKERKLVDHWSAAEVLDGLPSQSCGTFTR